MKRARTHLCLQILLLLGCAVLGYLALRQRTEVVRVDTGLKAADQAGQTRLADLRRQLAAAEADQQQAEKQADQLAKAPSGGSNARTVHMSDIAKEHPEYAAILAHQARRNMLQQYGAAFDSLNLRPEQLSKLKDLLVERNLTSNDAQQAATAAGLAQGSPAFWTAIKQATDAVDQEITSALGTDGAGLMQKLQTASNSRNQISYNYAPDFDDAGVSLTPDQSRSLAQVLSNAISGNAKNFADTSARQAYFKADPATGLSPSDNHTLEAAAQVLSPAQLQILKADQIRSNQQGAILQPYFTGATGISIVP